jgi:aldehyde:ferredoxin oxidoreductase
MAYGHAGQVLRVDLTTRRTWTEPLPPAEVLRAFVGCTGLALYYLATETPRDARPTDPETPLIFMTGPLTGTRAPSSSNHVIVSLSYDVPYAAGAGHSHGFWAAYLKFAGYDGVIVTGASSEPVYLWIDDDRVEIRDARAVWGKGTRETERLIKAELGGDPAQISVACIGPAGESLLHGASVKNDRNHGAGKGSPGAVMGAKRLKAIAVRGSGTVSLAAPGPFLATAEAWEGNLFVTPEGGVPPVAALLRSAGITRHYTAVADLSMLAGKNLTDPEWGKTYARNYVQGCTMWRVDPQPSYNCSIACAYNVRITSGPFQGMTVSLCGGGENTEGAAALIGVEDPGAALVMTDHYDDIGLESSTGGAVLGMAFEAYNRGIITKEDTEGLDLSWGNYEAALELLQQMIEHRGFGGRLTGGLKAAAAAVGGGADRFLVHVKGAGINLHDWRPVWSVLLGQVIAGTGPSWQAPGVDAWTGAPDFGYLRHPPGTTPEGKPQAVRVTQIEKIWEDCLGVCWFACWGVKDVTRLAAQAVAQATGWEDFTREEGLAVGERVINLMRLIALSRGFTKENEFDISPRLLEPPPAGRAAGISIAPYLRDMVEEYYRLMGWDSATGRPTAATIDRLGLWALAERLGVAPLIAR